MLRLIRITAYVLLLALGAAWGIKAWESQPPSTSAQVDGRFSLTDMNGHEVTDRSWPGRWKLVYFGYTYCPDVCPTELQTISSALDLLGEAGAGIVPLFITVDPARDTPAMLADYVKLFDPRLIGLTGTDRQIADVAAAYKVYYSRVTPPGSTTYLMDHSAFSYLVAPDGSLRAQFPPGMTADAMAAALRTQLVKPQPGA